MPRRRGCLFLGVFDGSGLIEEVVRRGGREFVSNHGLDGDLGRRTLLTSREEGRSVNDRDRDDRADAKARCFGKTKTVELSCGIIWEKFIPTFFHAL